MVISVTSENYRKKALWHLLQTGIRPMGGSGRPPAQELALRGVKVVGVSDHTACYFDPRGLDVPALVAYAAEKRVLAGFSNELAADPATLLTQECDILVAGTNGNASWYT